ncbi:Belongs to the small heat shock protein (HSP20) [Homalodisca vitripennis]|nr:Belongs to the small heat shock protein (HSP20) [Homalodisca vitripennis]
MAASAGTSLMTSCIYAEITDRRRTFTQLFLVRRQWSDVRRRGGARMRGTTASYSRLPPAPRPRSLYLNPYSRTVAPSDHSCSDVPRGEKRNIPIKLGDFSVIDTEFSNIRERFDAEMRKMEDEMTRVTSSKPHPGTRGAIIVEEF